MPSSVSITEWFVKLRKNPFWGPNPEDFSYIVPNIVENIFLLLSLSFYLFLKFKYILFAYVVKNVI
jgi:hypothetical protein